MDRRFIIILGLIVASMVGLFIFTNNKSSDDGNLKDNTDPTVILEDDHISGNKDASVKLIEYTDFQCPSCASIYPVMFQMEQEFSEQVTFVYRNFPLPTIHKNAMAAHRAAEAASLQGKYFDMSDLLYTRQTQWQDVGNASSIFETYAQEISLNMDKFRQDASGQQVFDRVSRDIKSAGQLSLTGTPAFILNGKIINIPRSVDEFRQVLQDAVDSSDPTKIKE